MSKTKDKYYVEDHRLAYWFSIGSAVIGFLLMAAPWLSAGSSAFALLPIWAVSLWGGFYGLGGLLSWWGLTRGSPRAEAAGMALLAGALIVSLLTTAVYRGIGGAISVGYLAFLALGCATRSWSLANKKNVDGDAVEQIVEELRIEREGRHS